MANEFNIKNGFISNGDSIVKNNLNVSGTTTSAGDVRGLTIKSTQSSGDEGGQLDLTTPQTNTTLSGDTVSVDIYQNRFRIFESGGSNRGVYIDLTQASNGVGSDLLNPTTTSSFNYGLSYALNTSNYII